MQISIIIDRIGNTNVYNIIQDSRINNPVLTKNEQLISIIDDDLIAEYLHELNRVSNVARSLSGLSQENEHKTAFIFEHLNLYEKLKQVGETLYRQLIPVPLQSYISDIPGGSLFFHIDQQLASIPFEILFDGHSFLWEKFRVGKTVKGRQGMFHDSEPAESINMLIIADPTEDLEWARIEGETLLEQLSVALPEKKISIELLGGRGATKLTLLNAIQGRDIIHYAGHLHHNERIDENGWILYDQKILHSREITKSGAKPSLIFSNSCASGRAKQLDENAEWYGQFASSFLSTTESNYIGTNWQMPDSNSTLQFIQHFYSNLFSGSSIGEALQLSRKFARDNFNLNDLTWASYLLIGNPDSRILRSGATVPDLENNLLDPRHVMEKFPFGVAEAYSVFHRVSEAREKPVQIVLALSNLAKQFILFVTSVILANLDTLKVQYSGVFDPLNIPGTLETLYSSLAKIKALRTHPVMPNLMEILYVHKDSLLKLAAWSKKIEETKLSKEEFESYEITMQYLLETILLDFDAVRNYGFYRIMEPGYRQLSLQGTTEYHGMRDIILPTQANVTVFNEITEKTTSLVGKCVFFNPIKRIFLDLSPYMNLKIEHQGNLYEILYTRAEGTLSL